MNQAIGSVACSLLVAALAFADDFHWRAGPKKATSLTLCLDKGGNLSLVTTWAPVGRPYLHPIYSPDGKNVLTEDGPAHHKHQTGLFVGFLKVNNRDFFHNRGKDYFRFSQGRSAGRNPSDPQAFWENTYELLDKAENVLLVEKQDWRLTHDPREMRMDLTLTYTAKQDVTFGKHDYGGLFLRMPWRQKTGGKATNSEGQENAKAEGKKARWVDVGMPIEGHNDWGHIAILDHKYNFRHPPLWRVDGQLGVGPAISRGGEWKLAKGKTIELTYRLVVYTGDMDKKRVESAWKDFVGGKR